MLTNFNLYYWSNDLFLFINSIWANPPFSWNYYKEHLDFHKHFKNFINIDETLVVVYSFFTQVDLLLICGIISYFLASAAVLKIWWAFMSINHIFETHIYRNELKNVKSHFILLVVHYLLKNHVLNHI